MTVIASSVIVSPFVELAACSVTVRSQSAAVLTVVPDGAVLMLPVADALPVNVFGRRRC